MNSISLETAAATVGIDDIVLLEMDPQQMPIFEYDTLSALIDLRYTPLLKRDFLEKPEIKAAIEFQQKLLQTYPKTSFFHHLVHNGCGRPGFACLLGIFV